MKTIITFISLSLTMSTIFSQGLPLPYYTGFDSPAEQAGWQEYRTGFISNYSWGNNGSLSHDYNVGANPTDTVIDWYVSPALNITSNTTISMQVKTAGFSTPTLDNCEIWFGSNDPNPATGNFVLIANLSYMVPQYQWLDTTINIPYTSSNGYIAFKYKTIGAAWATYSIDTITVSAFVGIDKTEHSNKLTANVSPNPFNSFTTIYFSSQIVNQQLDLYNIYGQKVRTINNISGQQYKLDRTKLTAGIYFFHLSKDNNKMATGKLIITD